MVRGVNAFSETFPPYTISAEEWPVRDAIRGGSKAAPPWQLPEMQRYPSPESSIEVRDEGQNMTAIPGKPFQLPTTPRSRAGNLKRARVDDDSSNEEHEILNRGNGYYNKKQCAPDAFWM